MKKVGCARVGVLALFACGENTAKQAIAPQSENEFYAYFYPYDTIPKVYVYRNIADGLEEQFHRVFSLNDSEGEHIVVETYTDDGRLTEALNYNLDSLDLIDHMVVDRNQENKKGVLFKHRLIPMDRTSEAEFASRFPGVYDSTFFLKEITRKFSKEQQLDVMSERKNVVVFKDEIRLTLFNPWTKMEDVREGEAVSYYAEGIGLVEWHTPNKAAHYRLEKIISQKNFLELVSHE